MCQLGLTMFLLVLSCVVQLQLQRLPEVYVMAEGWVAQWRKFLHGRSMSDLPPGPIDNRSLLVVKGNSLELTRSKWHCLRHRCVHVSVLQWPLCTFDM